MTLDVFKTILSLAQEAAAFLHIDGVLLPLLALPPVAALCFAAVGLFVPRGRPAFRRALRPVRLACGGLLLALFLLAGAPAPAYGVIVLAQLLACALALPLHIPARKPARAQTKQPVLPRAKGTKGEGAKGEQQRPQADAPCAVRPVSPAEARPRPIPPAPPAGEGQAAFHAPPPLQPVPPAPPAAMPPPPASPQPAREGSVVVERDVRLGHIFSALERLRDLPLSAGDRLEAQKTEELLTVYRAKGALSPAEADTLNDILAALLKMMAKYRL